MGIAILGTIVTFSTFCFHAKTSFVYTEVYKNLK